MVITTGCHLRYLNHSLFNCFLCTILGYNLDFPAPCSHVLRPSRSLTHEIVPEVGPYLNNLTQGRRCLQLLSGTLSYKLPGVLPSGPVGRVLSMVWAKRAQATQL